MINHSSYSGTGASLNQISKSDPEIHDSRLPASASIKLRYFPPDDDLKDHISTFYIAHLYTDKFDEYERADRPQFRFTFPPNGHYIFGNHQQFPAFRTNIIGPTSGRVRAIQYGPTLIFGFGLLPAGWSALVGDDAARLTDQSIDAADIFGPWIDDIAAAIEAAPDDPARLTLGNNMVREIFSHAEQAPMWFISLVDQWLTSSPSPKISDLVASTNISLRTIERMTKIYYGLSPRLLARKYRAVRAANILARGDSLEASDLANAFYDQSHLIREIKHFAGATPRQLQRPSSFVSATVHGRKSLSGKVSNLVADT